MKVMPDILMNDSTHVFLQFIQRKKNGIKEIKDPFIIIILILPMVLEIIFLLISYWKRWRLCDGAEIRSEFDNCRKNVLGVLVILCASQHGLHDVRDFYGQPKMSLILITSRIMSVLVSCPFLILYRRNNTTAIEYFNRRFNETRYTWVICILGFLLFYTNIGYTASSFYRSLNALGLDSMSCISIWFVYSILTVAVGGLRGFIWVGAFRFLIICACYIVILVQSGTRLPERKIGNYWHQFITIKPDLKNGFNILFSSTIYFIVFDLITCTTGKYVNSFSHLKTAKWSLYLTVIPFGVICILQDLFYHVIYTYYDRVGCDLAANNTLDRQLLVHSFFSNILGNPEIYHVLYILSLIEIGGFAISDSMMTAWYHMSFLMGNTEKGRNNSSLLNRSSFHLMLGGGMLTGAFFILGIALSEAPYLYWIPYVAEVFPMSPGLMFTAFIMFAPLLPQLTYSALWNIPFLSIMVIITIWLFPETFPIKYDLWGMDQSMLCVFVSHNCSQSCRHQCKESRHSVLIVSLVAVFIMSIISVGMLIKYSKKSYMNLDQSLYFNWAITFWKNQRAKRRRKRQNMFL